MLTTRHSCSVPALRSFGAMDRLFEDLFRGSSLAAPAFADSRSFPAVNSREDDEAFHVELELPGFDRKDFEITIHGNVLEIAGERRDETDETDENTTWHRRERHVGRFSRKLRFPSTADGGKVEARYENGVLTVTLPKSEAAMPRRIRVQS